MEIDIKWQDKDEIEQIYTVYSREALQWIESLMKNKHEPVEWIKIVLSHPKKNCG